MKRKLLFIFITSLFFISLNAEVNYVVSNEVLTDEQSDYINNKLLNFSNKHDIDIFLDVNNSENKEFNSIQGKDKRILISINIEENAWIVESSKELSRIYSKNNQERFMNNSKEDLSSHNFENLIKNLLVDIEEKIALPPKEKELFSSRRLIFSLVIALIIALIMAQANKNHLKTFKTRKTAVSYISNFEIKDKKDVLKDTIETKEYVDQKDTRVTSGKF